ncbi:MAG: hypothetical protein AAB455_01290 [Patescibacteria group bacterium]
MDISHCQAHLKAVYGRRNAICLPSLNDRLSRLLLVVGELQNAVRKKQAVGVHLANALAWLFAVVNHFHDLPFAAALCHKYPPDHCGYCKAKPCQCLEARSTVGDAERNKARIGLDERSQALNLHLDEFQAQQLEIYGVLNQRQGIDNVLLRLLKEICEVVALGVKTSLIESVPEQEWEYALELADVCAWIMSAGNVLDVDVSAQLAKIYGGDCPACAKRHCECIRDPFLNRH